MGCTGSKYQTLSADSATNNNETHDTPADSPQDTPSKTAKSSVAEAHTPSTPMSPTTPTSPISPSTPSTPGSAKLVPPWAEGNGSPIRPAIPEFEPPLVEAAAAAEVDNLDVEMNSAEERFPPWKDGDKLRSNNLGTTAQPVPASSSSACVVPSDAVQTASAEQAWEPITTVDNTCIIFDWDDTLFCSSALHCCLPNQFLELEEMVQTTLHAAMKLGRTIIVTNAMESWIQETTRRFMPRLMPTLEKLLIVYARKNWERLWPGDTFAWKRECFRELLNDQRGLDLNLLVIGDSLSEIRAAEGLKDHLGSAALIKTVKFKALPSPSDLLGELRTTTPELSRLVKERQSLSKELYQDVPSGSLFQGASLFQGSPTWQMLDAVPSEMFTRHPDIFAHQNLWSVMPTPPAKETTTQITI